MQDKFSESIHLLVAIVEILGDYILGILVFSKYFIVPFYFMNKLTQLKHFILFFIFCFERERRCKGEKGREREREKQSSPEVGLMVTSCSLQVRHKLTLSRA